MASISNTDPRDSQSKTDRDRLFELSHDLICIAGLDGYFRQVNPSWTRVLGWSREELLAQPVERFMHPEDRERTLAARAGLARGVPVRGLENRYLCKDGSYRWLSWQTTVEPGGAMVFGVAHDITEKRLLEQKELVMSKLESTATLAGGIAHDFNNLLAGILLNLEMIGVAGPLTDRQQEFVRQGMENIRTAHTLTQELLVFSRNGSSSVWKTADISPLLRQSLDLALSGSNIRGEIALADDLLPARIDESQLALAFRNLILNAREAMPSGGTVRLRAENAVLPGANTPAGLPAGHYLHITVADEGDGISREILPKIFDPYFSTKQRGSQKGMGLGLTICHSIIEKHDGALAVDSQPGNGTRIHCWLPAVPAKDASVAKVDASAAGSTPRILVMDDEPGLRTIMAQSIEGLGFQVELAAHGDEAVSLYKNARDNGAPFSAVLLDMTIRGGMGGCETMKILRDHDPDVKGALLTGYHKADILNDYARHGFLLVLPKPFSMDNLRDALSRLLGASSPDTRPGA